MMEAHPQNTQVSPSLMTEYFGVKKTRRRKGGKLKDTKTVEAKNTVSDQECLYLTPESSPGSAHKEDKDEENVEPKSQCIDIKSVKQTNPGVNLQLPLQCGMTSNLNSLCDNLESQVTVMTPEPEDNKIFLEASHENHMLCASPVTKDTASSRGQVLAEAPKGDLPVSPPTVPDLPREALSTPAKGNKEEVLPSCDSPSVMPRTKLRKNTTSGSPKAATEAVKPKPGRRKKTPAPTTQTHPITDYFPIRRSNRQTKSEIDKEKQLILEKLILSGCENGLMIKEFEDKGRGIMATKDFEKGDYVIEYVGNLMDIPSARAKEAEYSLHQEIGCYMYFFKCGDKAHCIDATAESERLGRLINHSVHGNCMTRSLMLEGIPRLILVAKRNIEKEEELSYDYGDRSKEALLAHPWLKL